MNQPSATQMVQSLLSQEQTLLTELGTLVDRERSTRQNLERVRAAIEGIRIGQQLAAEAVEAAKASEASPQEPSDPEATPED